MRIQYDHYGNFTLADGEHVSDTASYESIAVLEANGKRFVAVSPYHGNDVLEAEKVYELVPVETDVGPSDATAPCNLYNRDEACPHGSGSVPGPHVFRQ